MLHVKAANLILRDMVKTPSNYLYLDIQTSLLPGSLYFLTQTFQPRIGSADILGDWLVPLSYHKVVNHVLPRSREPRAVASSAVDSGMTISTLCKRVP